VYRPARRPVRTAKLYVITQKNSLTLRSAHTARSVCPCARRTEVRPDARPMRRICLLFPLDSLRLTGAVRLRPESRRFHPPPPISSPSDANKSDTGNARRRDRRAVRERGVEVCGSWSDLDFSSVNSNETARIDRNARRVFFLFPLHAIIQLCVRGLTSLN